MARDSPNLMSAFPTIPAPVRRLQARVEGDLAAKLVAAGKDPAPARGAFARLGLAGSRAKKKAATGRRGAAIVTGKTATLG